MGPQDETERNHQIRQRLPGIDKKESIHIKINNYFSYLWQNVSLNIQLFLKKNDAANFFLIF